MYTNEKIEQLIKERDNLNNEIEKEIQIEQRKYKFSWKRFAVVLIIAVSIPIEFNINKKIFTENSIWSWSYYLK